jgi:hypothetical protein
VSIGKDPGFVGLSSIKYLRFSKIIMFLCHKIFFSVKQERTKVVTKATGHTKLYSVTTIEFHILLYVLRDSMMHRAKILIPLAALWALGPT